MSPGSFAVRVQLKQDRGRSVTTLLGAVDAEQRPQVFTMLSYRIPRRGLKRLARVVIRRLYGTCFAHSHGAHGKTLPQRCRPLKSMLLPGSADCTDSSFSFFFFVPDDVNTTQLSLRFWADLQREFGQIIDHSFKLYETSNKNYGIFFCVYLGTSLFVLRLALPPAIGQ